MRMTGTLMTMNLYETYRFFRDGGSGVIVKKDGTRERGPCVDYQHRIDDPDGIGYISILVAPHTIHDVYANELAGVEIDD